MLYKLEQKENELTDNCPDPPFVVALTIVRGPSTPHGGISDDSEVLVCVRNGVVNRTHPEVVSVPTQRIPAVLAERILDKNKSEGTEGDTLLYREHRTSSLDANGHNELIYIVEALLARKLGIGDSLETDCLTFEAALAGSLEGIAQYPNLCEAEPLRMLNVVVYLRSGAKLFPERTESYDLIKWAPVKGFLKMWYGEKDPREIGLSGQQAMGVCVDGLCIASSADVLSAKLESQLTVAGAAAEVAA